MLIIKLNAIDSTNNFLKQLGSTKLVEDYTVVVAETQTNGRGQMGSKWASEDHKNLTFSVFKVLNYFNLNHQFYLNIIVALSLFETLKYLNIPNLSVKWPNDILSANKKIAGILVENVIKQQKITSSVIGIGLNVNQTNFIDLPQASSLKLITNKTFDKAIILERFITVLKTNFIKLETKQFSKLKTNYESLLFKNQLPSTFKNIDNQLFSGIIKGITEAGLLKIIVKNGSLKTFNLKEVTLLY